MSNDLAADRLAGGGQCYRLHLFGLDRGVVGLERERQNGRQTFQTEGHGFALRGLARLGAVMGYECRHEGIVGAVEIAALLRTLRTERDVERRSVDGRVDGLVGPVLLLLSQLAFEHFGVGVVGEFRSFLAGGAAFGVDRQLVGRLPRTGETAVGLVDLDLRAALGQRGFEADLDFAGATGIWSAASSVEQAAMSVAVAATNNPLVNACFIWMSVLLFFDRIAVGIRHLIAPLVERFGISAGECLAGCKAGLHDNFRCGDFRTEIGLRPPPEIRNVLLHNHRIVVIFCVL